MAKFYAQIINIEFSVRMASKISWWILFYFCYWKISLWKKFESSSTPIIATQARLPTNCIFWRMWDRFLLVRFELILIHLLFHSSLKTFFRLESVDQKRSLMYCKPFLGEEKVIFLVPKSTNDFSTLIELAKKINSGLILAVYREIPIVYVTKLSGLATSWHALKCSTSLWPTIWMSWSYDETFIW